MKMKLIISAVLAFAALPLSAGLISNLSPSDNSGIVYVCNHEYADSTCTKCGDVCEHEEKQLLLRSCKDGHIQVEDCTNCDYTEDVVAYVPHEYEDGKCTVCEHVCDHNYEEDVCTECGAAKTGG